MIFSVLLATVVMGFDDRGLTVIDIIEGPDSWERCWSAVADMGEGGCASIMERERIRPALRPNTFPWVSSRPVSRG